LPLEKDGQMSDRKYVLTESGRKMRLDAIVHQELYADLDEPISDFEANLVWGTGEGVEFDKDD